MSDEFSQKILDHAKQSATDALKNFFKNSHTKEATGDLIGNKNYNYRITKFAKALQQNYSETVANEHDKEIPKVR